VGSGPHEAHQITLRCPQIERVVITDCGPAQNRRIFFLRIKNVFVAGRKGLKRFAILGRKPKALLNYLLT
jgi:hypothetical protein